jgi:inosine-uridine nucleoside N-ribohydrolase
VVVLVHLDTDLGGDIDDACALAFLLGQPQAELAGVTTVTDQDGRRAGYVRHCLDLAGRDGIPVIAGAVLSMTTLRTAEPVIADDRYWPSGLPCCPSPPGAALDLLASSIERGATVIAIGPLTNLALLEIARPGSLRQARVVAAAGWTGLGDGLPAWGPEMDFNVQWDTRAAEIVAATASLTLVPLPVTLRAQFRAAHLPHLRAAGPLGRLLARQGQAHGHDYGMNQMGRAHPALPDDLLNFQYDPLACAVALHWPGVTVEEAHLQLARDGDLAMFQPAPGGRPMPIVTDLDPDGFAEHWLTSVEASQPQARCPRRGLQAADPGSGRHRHARFLREPARRVRCRCCLGDPARYRRESVPR